MKKNAFILLAFMLVIITSCKSEKKEEPVIEEALELQESSKAMPDRLSSFSFKPVKPVDGKLKGVVELGASGFNSFIIDVDKDLNYEVKKKEFGNSLILEGMTNSTDVNSKLKDYIQKIVEYGVNPKDIHFVVSSGAAKEKATKLISNELKSIGYVVNTVTPEEEGVYALKAVLPPGFSKTFVVDIGSGNTKISYLNDDKSITGLETYGAKYYQKEIGDEKVYNDVKAIANKVPKSKVMQCFMIGGVPYKLAKSVRKDKNERYTVLSVNIDDFAELAKDEGKKVKSGLNIYRAIVEASETKKVIFDWDANFTIGFLLSETK